MDEYARRITAAVTGTEMNSIAADAAIDDSLTAAERQSLQAYYAARMRQLWPNSFRRK